jgi:hypothetical protein
MICAGNEVFQNATPEALKYLSQNTFYLKVTDFCYKRASQNV